MIGELISGVREGAPTGATDGLGNPVIGAPTPFSFTTVAPCAPVYADESADATGVRVVTGYKVYAAADLVLQASDILTIRGVGGWQVEGEVGRWNRAADGSGRGVEFLVRRAS